MKTATETKKMKLIVDVKELGKFIDSIKKRASALDYDIHRAAVSIAQHVNIHHEVSLVNRLVDSLGKGHRANALRDWFCTFGKVAFDEEKQVFIAAPKDKPLTDIEKAKLVPWYEFKKEAAFKPVNLAEELAKLVKRCETALATPDEEKRAAHKVTAADLLALRELTARISA